MQHSSDTIDYYGVLGDSLQVSQDGYIRMSLPAFMELPLSHFLSGLDNEPNRQTVEGGIEASISGYSEWLSDTSPRVTVGWDWRLDLTTGSPRYLREGMPRSNIMLIDSANGQDLGEETTEASIASRIDLDGLSSDLGKHITSRYS